MWKKIMAVTILFYFFALLQTSFFAHFSFFGAVPDLVFTLFFVLAFFSFAPKDRSEVYKILFLAVGAGFFMDLFLNAGLGPSILSLVIIGLALNRLQASLKVRDEQHPLLYFLPLFIISISAYYLFMGIILYFLVHGKIAAFLGIKMIFSLIYDSVFAIVFFYAYKRISSKDAGSKRRKLFR